MSAGGVSTKRWSSLGWPLGASLVFTAWVMLLFCRLQLGSRLTWPDLFLTLLGCGVMTALVHGVAVAVVRGILRRSEMPAAWVLIRWTWLVTAWVPALMVLAMDASIWVALVVPVLVGSAAAVLLRWKPQNREVLANARVQSVFQVPSRAAWEQTVAPALLMAVAVQLAVLCLARRFDWTAAWLLAVANVYFLLRTPRKRGEPSGWMVAGVSALALMVTVIALVPFLKPGKGELALALLAMQQSDVKAVGKKPPPPRGGGFSGIILTLPPKPKEKVLPPTPGVVPVAGVPKPKVIPFDGVYWYFREPDDRPKKDARRVEGDPLKAEIRSTNVVSLQMEAHQRFDPALDLSCCSTLRVEIVNAETRPGVIAIQVLVRDPEAVGQEAVLVGTVVAPSSIGSSIDPLRAPVRETLTFTIPHRAQAVACGEMTVRIQSPYGRKREASKVSVEGFVLVP